MENLMALQNGSDVRGVACEGVEGESVNLTEKACNLIAASFVKWLSKKTGKDAASLLISAGRDARITGEKLLTAALAGLTEGGAKVIDCGLATTPAMFMSTVFSEMRCDGAVMITASHLPFNRNGMKFFDKDGGLEHEDIEEILKTAVLLNETSDSRDCHGRLCRPRGGDASRDGGFYRYGGKPLMELYAAHLRRKIMEGLKAKDGEKCLTGLHIVVDAGNGDAGFFVKDVLEVLGADTTGSQFLEADGMFPNHIPNPENKAAMEAIKKATVENKADLGLIFDTDVDRMSCVLHDGTVVSRDAIIALAAAIVSPQNKGGIIITDSVTSDRLTQFIEGKLGMKHLRYMRGYKNVIDKCKELNAAGKISPLAMETSGHGALKENYYLDDGAFLAVKIIISLSLMAKQGKALSDLISSLPAAGEEGEWRFKIKAKDFKAYGKQVLSEFEKRARKAGYDMPESYEGVRVSFHGEKDKASGASGWALLRLSLHDPVMPLNIEGMKSGDKDRIAKAVQDIMGGFEMLDVSCLKA